MILPDVNIFVNALHTGSQFHPVAYPFLSKALVADEPVAFWDVSLVATYRILTNPNLGNAWSDPAATVEAIEGLRSAPSAVSIAPGPRYWQIFTDLARASSVRGALASDAMLAALAIEHGCRIATFDRDFARFPGLDWFTPTA